MTHSRVDGGKIRRKFSPTSWMLFSAALAFSFLVFLLKSIRASNTEEDRWFVRIVTMKNSSCNKSHPCRRRWEMSVQQPPKPVECDAEIEWKIFTVSSKREKEKPMHHCGNTALERENVNEMCRRAELCGSFKIFSHFHAWSEREFFISEKSL